MQTMEKQDAGWMLFGALLAAVGAVMTGCSGIELHATTGIRRVDEHKAEQVTHREHTPLKCYLWADCRSATVEGS